MAPTNRREVAHRLFAAEYNASRFEIKGSADERSPGYVVSPLGAKANRVLVVGVLTEVETVGEAGTLRRARVSDPTGLYTVYAGQYQPDAMAALDALEPPQYVAVVGKTRVYEPEPGKLFLSLRPETVTLADEHVRNQWVLETARHTRERVRAVRRARDLRPPTPDGLREAGVPGHLAEGALLAHEKYGDDVDLDYFDRLLKDTVAFLLEGEMPPPPAAPPVRAVAREAGAPDAVESRVLGIIQGLAGADEKGAQWDLIVGEGGRQGLNEDQVEEALNGLMDKGVVYEPILGRLKMA